MIPLAGGETMRRGIAVAVCLFVIVNVPAARADDKPLDRAELDKRAAKVAYDAALAGSDLFNKGRHDECVRLYQGALMALLPMLDHQPMLTATVKDKLDKAQGLRAIEGAFVLREALDAVIGKPKPGKPLWDR